MWRTNKERMVSFGAVQACGGIKPGDRCMSINGVDLSDASDKRIARLCLDVPGTAARVLIRPGGPGADPGAPAELVLTRVRPDAAAGPGRVETGSVVGSEASFDSMASSWASGWSGEARSGPARSVGGSSAGGAADDGRLTFRGLGLTFVSPPPHTHSYSLAHTCVCVCVCVYRCSLVAIFIFIYIYCS